MPLIQYIDCPLVYKTFRKAADTTRLSFDSRWPPGSVAAMRPLGLHLSASPPVIPMSEPVGQADWIGPKADIGAKHPAGARIFVRIREGFETPFRIVFRAAG